MAEHTFDHIILEIRDERAFLIINHPPLNILNIPAMEEINKAIRSLRGSTDVKVLVLKGSGEKAFSAGVDVSDHTREKVARMLHEFHEIFRSLASIDQITVAALKGLTLGGGCEIALFCDLAVAADNLKIGQPEVKLSAVAPVALLILPQLVGLKKAAELLLSGKIIEAPEALQVGLVNAVFPLQSFDKNLDEYLKSYSELSLVGLKFSKRGIRLGLEKPFWEALKEMEQIYLGELMATKDAHEGLKAFMDKRKPQWKNR